MMENMQASKPFLHKYKFINRKLAMVLMVLFIVTAVGLTVFGLIPLLILTDLFGDFEPLFFGLHIWLIIMIATALILAWLVRTLMNEKIDPNVKPSQEESSDIERGNSSNRVLPLAIVGMVALVIFFSGVLEEKAIDNHDISPEVNTDTSITTKEASQENVLDDSQNIPLATNEFDFNQFLQRLPLVSKQFNTRDLSLESINEDMAFYQEINRELFSDLNLNRISQLDIASKHHILGKVVYAENTGVFVSQIMDDEASIFFVLYNSSMQITDSLKIFNDDSSYTNPFYGRIHNDAVLITLRETAQREKVEDISYNVGDNGKFNLISKIVKAEIINYSEYDFVSSEGQNPWNDNFEPIGKPIVMGTTLESKDEHSSIKSIMDYNIHTAWIESEQVKGVGSKFGFKLAAIPNIRPLTIFEGRCYVMNGHYNTEKTWNEHSRVKKLQAYLNDVSLAVIELDDFRGVQVFDLSPFYRQSENEPNKKNRPLIKEGDILNFEILEVYPGSKYQQTAISEFFTNGATQ